MRKPLRNKINVSPYITPEGQRQLSEELSYLWKVKRPRLLRLLLKLLLWEIVLRTQSIFYGKKQLRQIDSRVRFLTKRLSELIVVNRIPDDTSRVFFWCMG